MNLRNSPHPYAMVTILFWSLAYVLTRLTLQYFSAFSLGFLRYAAASCALIVVAVVLRLKPPAKKDLPWFLASGAVGFFLYMIAFNKGSQTVPASTSSVVIATVPVITALLARLLYGEKLMALQWAAIAVEFSGVAALMLMNGIFAINTGLLWLLFAALLLSAYNLLQRRLTKAYSGVQTSAYSIFFGTLMLGVFSPAAVAQAKSAPPVQLIYVAILGVFSSAIAYVAWSQAFARAKKTSTVSNYMFVTPFLTTLLGLVIAGERPDASTIVGGGIILVGLALFNWAGRASKKVQEASQKALEN